MSFFDHLSRQHNTCHLCTDHHKNVYYKEYSTLETHFALSHFICPYEICKAKCFVAFRTEDELKAHLELEHKKSDKKEVKANALLGFITDDVEDQDGGGRGRGRGRGKDGKFGRQEANAIKDTEGIDFSYYFSNKYSHCLINRRKKLEDKKKHMQGAGDRDEADRGRGRGRGRGDRGRGRGRGRGDRGGRGQDEGREMSKLECSAMEAYENKVGIKSLDKITNPEEKLSAMLNIVSDFVK